MTDILDIKPIIQVSLLWFWILLLVILIALGVWLYFFIRRRLHPVEKAKPEPLLSPREVALRDLEEFDHLGLLERSQYRKYYFRLSEIVRLFLQDEILLPAVDTTSEEIQPYLLKTMLLSNSEKELMSKVLSDMDLVKFARFVPSSHEVTELRARVRNFLQTAHLPVREESEKIQKNEGGVDVSS